MKQKIIEIIKLYLDIYPNEKEKLSKLIKYVNNHRDYEIIDWNNFDGHIVASGFVYAKKEKKFLVLFHKDLQMYLYPGGHIESNDLDIFAAAKREVKEETGIDDLKVIKLNDNELIPFDIDIHSIEYNKKLNLPEHDHFDFRYLFAIDSITEVRIDTKEISNYKWISVGELEKDKNYGIIVNKIKTLTDLDKD